MKRSKILLLLIILLAALLRFPELDKFPPSLYSDEVNQAYNAYSVLKTGRDEHGVFLPVSFRSFGDWKPPLQTYLMVPTVAVFGLTEFTVRFPNALLGVLSVFLTYSLVLELFDKHKEKIALLSSFFLSISPWHLHQSRSAMLVMVALFFFLLGVYFFVKSLKNKNFLIFSSISFVLTIYAYYGMRLVVPLFLLVMVINYFKFLLTNYKKPTTLQGRRFFVPPCNPTVPSGFIDSVSSASLRWRFSRSWNKTTLTSFFIGLALLLPLIVGFLKQPDVIFGRAKSVSVFFDRGVKLRISELQAQDGANGIIPKISLFFHNKPYLYFLDITRRYFSHFEGQFMFLKGDTASPFRIPQMGVLYLIEAFLFPLGLFYLIKNNERSKLIIISWLVIAVLPASLTFLTPAHNRSFNAVIPIIIISSYGVLNLLSKVKIKLNLLPLTFSVIYFLSLNFYLVIFYKILPQNYGPDWLYGFKQLVVYINSEQNQFSKVIFLPKTGMSYIYLLFYNQYPPELYQKEAVRDYVPDNLGFEYVKSFNKYIFFTKERSWEVLSHQMKSGELYIGREEEIPKEFSKYEVYYPDGKVAFRVTYL